MRSMFTFKLTDSDRDRVVDAYIDQLMERGENASEYIKELIYRDAVGSDRGDRILREIEDIKRLLTSGVLVYADSGEPVSENDELFSPLDNFGT